MADNLTWVKGSRDPAQLDETSRKILSAGRKPDARTFGQDLMRGEGAKAFKAQSRQAALQKTGNSKAFMDTGAQLKGNLWHGGTSESNAKVTEVTATGTSIFDPVLCELAYRWFCPPNGKVLDPFAGGSVRGIVAAYLGFDYTGIELRPEQNEANAKQAKAMQLSPHWITGDSVNADTLAAGDYDLIFSCPPYYDLEVYSDLPGEMSAIPTYQDFIKKYREIIAKCCAMLKPDRFACFVVGDVRDKKGFYRNFPADTIAAFHDAGVMLYNEAILVTAVGSLPIRVGKQFGNYRKLGKTHQNVLIFFKGDTKTIKINYPEIEIGEGGLTPTPALQ